MQLNTKIIISFFVVAVFIFSGVNVEAWSSPSQYPTAGNSIEPMNEGSDIQTKIGGLIFNSGNSLYGLLVRYGKVGIGTLTPNDLFEVDIKTSVSSQKPCTTNCTGYLTSYGPIANGNNGYAFTPNKNGQITQLHLNAPYTGYANYYQIKLSDTTTGTTLALVTLPNTGYWLTSSITPVNVTAGTRYSVTASGYGNYYSTSFSMKTYGDLQIDYGINSSGQSYTTMYGLVDVTFVPSSYLSVFSVKSSGSVGLLNSNPASLLSVSGGIQIGADSATCTSAKAGTLRWQFNIMQICNGSAWISIMPAASCTASGGCAASVDGSTCNTYNVQFSSSCPSPTVSTCSNGTWSPTPLQYASCSTYASCAAVGSCPVTAHGGTCSWNATSGSKTSCPANTVSTCNNGTWSPLVTGSYSSCIKQCAGLNACADGNEGDVCRTNDVDISTSCPEDTISTCTNYVWTPTPKSNTACIYPVYGCTNSNASNYDSSATIDDGSCSFGTCGTGPICECEAGGGSWENGVCI